MIGYISDNFDIYLEYFIVKIIAEFSRIMGRDMRSIYGDAWKTLMQDVLLVAAIERDNYPVQVAIRKAGRHLSDGIYTHNIV